MTEQSPSAAPDEAMEAAQSIVNYSKSDWEWPSHAQNQALIVARALLAARVVPLQSPSDALLAWAKRFVADADANNGCPPNAVAGDSLLDMCRALLASRDATLEEAAGVADDYAETYDRENRTLVGLQRTGGGNRRHYPRGRCRMFVRSQYATR